jgi:hypothetical protein
MANDSEACRSEGINTFTFQEHCREKSDGSFAPTKEAWLKIHPDRNLSCKDDAKEKFNVLTEKCNKGPTDTTPAIWSRIPATTPSSRYKSAFPSGMSQDAKNYISRSQGAANDPFIDDPHKDVREDSSNVLLLKDTESLEKKKQVVRCLERVAVEKHATRKNVEKELKK